jgi:crotonobetainyl-CoA:carnitine CoA-transferase CaiB-like acyl-CoA transferase
MFGIRCDSASAPYLPRQGSKHFDKRGLKVVDLSRVIAAPTVTRGLAELGASIMRVTSSAVCDTAILHIDLNWEKWNCNLDLRIEEHRDRHREFILDADAVVQGYRPCLLDKYGFG